MSDAAQSKTVWFTPYTDKPKADAKEVLQFFPESLHEELEAVLMQGAPVYVPEWNEREITLMNALLWNRLHFGNELLRLVFVYGFLQGQLYESDRIAYIEKSKRSLDEQKQQRHHKKKPKKIYI